MTGTGALSWPVLAPVLGIVTTLVLTGCSGGPAQDVRPTAGTGSASPGRQATVQPPPPPVPSATSAIGTASAAAALVAHPTARVDEVWPNEAGDLLVVWRVAERWRDHTACRHPVAVVLVPRAGWASAGRAARHAPVRSWLLAAGTRGVVPTADGFVLSQARCREGVEVRTSPALLVGERSPTQLPVRGSASGIPATGTVAVSCWAGDRSTDCVYAPGSGSLRPWAGHHFDGPWRGDMSLMWKPSSHITGTWSVDGGETWNELLDPWGASVVRDRTGETFVIDQRGPAEVYRLYREPRPGELPWAVRPDPAGPVVTLPRSRDGYRWWTALPDGTLVGTARGGAVYVSDGPDWSRVTRRPTPYSHVETVGDLLVSSKGPALAISEDHGRSWEEVDVREFVPEP